MLGRLKMTTTEALKQYAAVAEKIFSKKNKKRWGVQDGIFKATTLETEMKTVIREMLEGDCEAKMFDKSLTDDEFGHT
jgi:hypothetical protein